MAKESIAIPVSDRPAETWIKLLVAVAMIAVGLTGYIGDRLIDGQDRTTKEVSKINGFLQTHESRITRNERDIKELSSFHLSIQHGLNQGK